MFTQALQILEGYKNLIKDKMMLLPEEEEELFSKRYDVCLSCKFRNPNTDQCNICICYLPSKTKCVSCKCPKEYW